MLAPVLALLLGRVGPVRLRLYALAKLRAALSCMPSGTMPLLSHHAAPADLWRLCRESMLQTPLAPQRLLEEKPSSLFKLLVASTFLVVLTSHGAFALYHHLSCRYPFLAPCLADHASCDRSPSDDPS